LFGRGSVIKHEMLLENPKEMYGYGLEGYGYRYPPTLGYYEQPIVVGTITEGHFKGYPLKRYALKVDEKWIAAYVLNKKIAEKNEWLKYVRDALQDASKKYLAKLQETNPKAYEDAMKAKEKRLAKKGQLPLALRPPVAKALYDQFKELSYEDLLKHYYSGRRVPKPKKKTVLLEVPA
jgi:hypothetical protein